ncbi:MAG: cupin domain-containing protein [Bacillota bacterium]
MEAKLIRFRTPKPAGSPPILKEELYRSEAHDFNWVRLDPGFTKEGAVYPAGDAFMFLVEGSLTVTVDDRRFELEPGDLVIVPRGATRGFVAGPAGATFMAAHLRG